MRKVEHGKESEKVHDGEADAHFTSYPVLTRIGHGMTSYPIVYPHCASLPSIRPLPS